MDSAVVASPVSIIRFDKILYDWLKKPEQPVPEQLTRDYKSFLELYSKYIVEVGSPDSASFASKMQKHFADSLLFRLYTDTENKYSALDDIELRLGKAFDEFHFYFPLIKIPTIYMHVSGLNQSVIVGENILSLSIDKYLGEDYPLYQNYFNVRQRRNMIRDRIVPDYLTGLLYSEFPFDPNDSGLLDNMIYQGKVIYALQAFLPDDSESLLLGFSEDELNLCLKNEKELWRYIIQNQHLYSKDYLIVSKYMTDASHSAFFTDDYPPRIGVFIGWRIVSRYMETNKTVTLPDLMNQPDSRQILSKSKYK
jgi:hypothetical protein